MINDIKYTLVGSGATLSVFVDAGGRALLQWEEDDSISSFPIDRGDITKLRDMLYNAESDIERLENNKKGSN